MSIEIDKQLCMKVSFPEDPKISRIFEGLPPLFKIEKEGGWVTVYCPVGYEISREFFKFKVREFYRIYRALRVEGGRKIWKGHVIILEPKKTKVLRVRFSPSELELLKIAADRAKESLPEYVRTTLFTRMARELGL
ncbi:MAG: hypothetical protein QXG35_09615 [Nitrososphaerota archaeon]